MTPRSNRTPTGRRCANFALPSYEGRRTPLNFKIVLSLAPENFAAFLEKHQIGACRAEDIQGLYLNFHYDGTTLQCITGTSMHTFTMDKTLEREWDAYVGKMLGNWREL